MIKGQRCYHLDILRILAISAVVLMHVSGHISLELSDNTSSLYWHICNIFDSGTRWAVPMFVMISGYLFLNPQKEISTKDIYKKYILRMAIAYVFWSFLYTLFLTIYSGSKLSGLDFVKNLIVGTITGGMYHLWFIPMLIGLYVLVPVLRVIVANASQRTLSYFVLVMALYISVLKTIVTIPFLKPLVGGVINTFGMGLSINGYILYFVLGYYINTVSFTKIQKRIIYILGLVSFLVTVGVTGAVSYFKGVEFLMFRDNFSINVFLMSASLFLFVKEKCANKSFSDKTQKVILFLSKYSFGLYLTHLFVLVILVDFYVCTGVGVLLVIILYFVISCVVSLFMSWVIGKIPVLKKYII